MPDFEDNGIGMNAEDYGEAILDFDPQDTGAFNNEDIYNYRINDIRNDAPVITGSMGGGGIIIYNHRYDYTPTSLADWFMKPGTRRTSYTYESDKHPEVKREGDWNNFLGYGPIAHYVAFNFTSSVSPFKEINLTQNGTGNYYKVLMSFFNKKDCKNFLADIVKRGIKHEDHSLAEFIGVMFQNKKRNSTISRNINQQ